ncbi:MAG: glycosyltransferase family 2 protein, partial [Acidimicrobiales bacterium]
MSIALDVVAVVVAVPALLTVAHLVLLAAASLDYRPAGSAGSPGRAHLLVIVPAHDEEAVIADALRSINASRRASDTVLVVADRCSDATAQLARDHGALVLERGLGSEPGRARAVSAGLGWAQDLAWDGVVAIDADCVVDPGFFDACARAIDEGAPVAQARCESMAGSTWMERILQVASALEGVLKPRGRDRLGLSVRLKGSGMVVSRAVLETYGFRNSGASEDLWLSLDLCVDGVLARHLDDARLFALSPESARAAWTQKVRWEAGRMYAAREHAGRLLRRRTLATLEAAVHVVTPPTAVAVLLLVAGAALAAAAGTYWLALALLAVIGLMATSVVTALFEARSSGAVWLALVVAPAYVGFKACVQVAALLRM